jgi:hypothetical protein
MSQKLTTASWQSAAAVPESTSGWPQAELIYIRFCSLRMTAIEVRAQIDDSAAKRLQRRTEGSPGAQRGGGGITAVVVQQHERDVVPVLWLAPATGRRRLRQKEAGQSGDVEGDLTTHFPVCRREGADLDVASGETVSRRLTAPRSGQPSDLMTADGLPACQG